MMNNNIPEIIWEDKDTKQKFVIQDGLRIYILSDGTRVSEEDLILEEEMKIYMEEEEEREAIERAEQELLDEQYFEEQERQYKEDRDFEDWWWYYGPGSEHL